MTYALLLLVFVVLPIMALSGALFATQRTKRGATLRAQRRTIGVTLLALIVVATLYTMPWDDHLIARGVWSYNPRLLSGVFLGHMPVEEVLFFPLQTLLIGLWWTVLAGRIAPPDTPAFPRTGVRRRNALGRVGVFGLGAMLWLLALIVLLPGWRPGTYLGWELAWALPPIILQLGVGADILWRDRRLIVAVIALAMLYLSAVDALAIHLGIWTIDPHQSTGLLIGGTLPLEEAVFFLLTTTLVTVGLHLGRSLEARGRLRAALGKVPLTSTWRPVQ